MKPQEEKAKMNLIAALCLQEDLCFYSSPLKAHILWLLTRQALCRPTCPLMFGVDSMGLHYYIFSTLNKHKTQIKVYFENYFSPPIMGRFLHMLVSTHNL